MILKPLATTPNKAEKFAKLLATKEAWNTGNLYYLADDNQEGLIKALEDKYDGTYREIAWNCVRRMGKSFALCLFAYMQCLKKPGLDVKYLAPNKGAVPEIIIPQFDFIINQCPAALRKECVPSWNKVDGKYTFPNGSTITVAGCNTRTKNALRGRVTDIGIIDEAGFVEDNEILRAVAKDVLGPAISERGGILIMASTPADTPSHYFVDFATNTMKTGDYYVRTIYDTPRYDPKKIENALLMTGGESTITFRREYLCQFIIDRNKAVLPEFVPNQESLIKTLVNVPLSREEIIANKMIKRPPYCDKYIVMDYGFFPDRTGVLFSYWDYSQAKLVIEGEILINGVTYDVISEAINTKRKELWGEEEVKGWYADMDSGKIFEWYDKYKMPFNKPIKFDKELSINQTNTLCKDHKLIISDKCVELLAQTRSAIWKNDKRNEFGRDQTGGHFDLIDALIYTVRNIDRGSDPTPVGYGVDRHNTVLFKNKEDSTTPTVSAFKALFGQR